MKKLEDILTEKYKYKKLPIEKSTISQTLYETLIPNFLQNQQPLYTSTGSLICSSFDRIVIGDYGAYVEFSSEQANKHIYIFAPKQEYRLDPRYDNIKYIQLTINDKSEVKIYYQKRTVSYADYQINKYYVSVYEVYPEIIKKIFDK